MSLNNPSILAPTGPAAPLPWLRVLVMVALMAAAAVASEGLRPSFRLSDHSPPIKLEQQIPESFGEWRIDRGIVPVLPNPSLQAALDALYSQTLARTYINAQGERIMLSIAYGSDQSNEATAVHRPEFCYSAQGFRVQSLGQTELNIAGTVVPVARLVGSLGPRVEPITYWVTLDEAATLPGLGRKLQQIRYGLRGQIPDGMLVRVSGITPHVDESFATQQRFLEQLFKALPVDVRARYFGAGQGG